MAELYLVRHGQASFGSDNYDQLSPLGYQQATWLGEYFSDRDIHFDRVITGDLARQRQTAEFICKGLNHAPSHEVHEGLNEFNFHRLMEAYIAQEPSLANADLRDARQANALLRKTLEAWSKNQINRDAIEETWQAFGLRVSQALSFARQRPSGKTLLVSSGGAMSMILKHVMAFDDNTLINVNLQTKNTGMHHFFYNEKSIFLTGLNHIPHLDHADRLASVTYT